LSRAADIIAVSRDPQTFRSSGGVLIGGRSRKVQGVDSILYLDPPQHVRHRKLVSSAFTPRRTAQLEDFVRGLARELLDDLPSREVIDFVDAYAAPLPMLVIAELLGVPPEDRDQFRKWSDAMMAAATAPEAEHYALAAELFAYFAERLAERKHAPADDLLSV